MPLSDTQLTEIAKARYLSAKQFAEGWRREAKQAYDFVACHQIDDKDRRELERNKRPAIVFNLIGPNLKAISGMERGNRQEIRYLPREHSEIDGLAAEIYNQTVKWVFHRNDNEYHESKAFLDMAITGMGWTQILLDFDEDPEGIINSPTIDPLRKLWDPSAKTENLSDRRYDFTEVLLDLDEFKAMGEAFEEFAKTHKLEARVFGGEIEDPFDFERLIEQNPDQYVGDSDFDPERRLGKIAVLEYNFFIREKTFQFLRDDGTRGEEFTNPDRAEELRASFGEDRVISLGRQRRYYKAWFNGESLIEQQPNIDPKAFTEYCITGEYDHNKGHFFGVVRAMIDPQQWSNKLFMQLLHIINSNAKGGFFFRSGVFKNKLKALRDWARGDRGIEVVGNDKIGDMVQERTPTPMPSAMHELLLFVTGIIPRVSGFNMELLGMAGKDQPGVLEHMRKQAGMTILAPFFDALRFYRKQKGKGLIFFMKEFVGPERMARIVTDETRKVLPQIINLPGVEKFDIHVEESPHSPNLKTANFIMLGEFLQTQPELAGLIGDLVLEQSPLPTSLTRQIKERLTQARQPDPLDQRQRIAEIVREEMAAFKDQTAAMLNAAKANVEVDKPELEQDKLDQQANKEVLEFAQTMAQVAASTQKNAGNSSGE